MMKKTVVLIIIVILLISVFIVLTKNEENPSFLKSGDSINVSGTISSVEYMNTTYGKIPFLSIDSIIDIFKKANLWDPEIYELTGSEEPAGLEIMGEIDKEYSLGERINV
ncbi:MAG TPA: hypothetical protein ENI51_04560, partial [Candidatus Atribacteria bacterium]|nr:hypothetical protein [Candidatus Atribacteria bacterium]